MADSIPTYRSANLLWGYLALQVWHIRARRSATKRSFSCHAGQETRFRAPCRPCRKTVRLVAWQAIQTGGGLPSARRRTVFQARWNLKCHIIRANPRRFAPFEDAPCWCGTSRVKYLHHVNGNHSGPNLVVLLLFACLFEFFPFYAVHVSLR